ncbi:hypothetical protein Taro_002470 [Colocasia esculenta]|uniref:Uncharacterized protein n=1 Tax=Colocasia esculenta TaxID=4460 RepID=A0A843TLP3_COLES|nr:hypothetical protein [Colocasia esculenta]
MRNFNEHIDRQITDLTKEFKIMQRPGWSAGSSSSSQHSAADLTRLQATLLENSDRMEHFLSTKMITIQDQIKTSLNFMEKRLYKHLYAKDESTHPSMVSTHQHRFKGKMCKHVETVSTHVKRVSTRVAVFQKSSLPRSTHSQSRFGTAGRHTQEQVDMGPSSQNSLLHILDSVSTLPPGQVDTLRKLFILKVDGCHVSF